MKFNGVLYSDWPSVVTGLFICTSKWRNNIAKNYRVNDRIRVPSVLLVDDKGNQLGEMSTPDAIALASERGLDLVLTAGILNTNSSDHAMSRIPGECHFSLEVRSQSIDTLEAFYQLLRSEAESVERERGVKFEFDDRSLASPAVLDQRWIDHLLNCCKAKGLNSEAIASGAGHDAAVFANSGIPSAMIFVRNENGSHNPKESMEIEDFMNGVDVLFKALLDPPL